MNTWYSKHVEESNKIWRINNIQCITLVVLYGQFMMHGQRNIKSYMHVQNLMNSLWDIRIFLGLVPKESPCITTAYCDNTAAANTIANTTAAASVLDLLLKQSVLKINNA